MNDHVLITGGSRGIGAAAVRLFSGRGDRVWFLYEKNHAAAEAVARETGAQAICCDVSDEEAVQAAQESEFLHRVLPEELSHRYYEEELKRCAALKAAADPAEYERVHYFNAI